MKSFIEKHQHLLSIICPVLVGVIFIALCCLNLGSSIWFDESYTSYLIRGDYHEIWSLTSIDVHPPFYYFALKTWSLVFGNSVLTLRFMSVFFGLIAIIFAFQLIKRHFGIRPAIISTFFMGISPIFVRYGQEMRMYTMVLAIVLAATYLLSLALETQASSGKKARKYWVVYALLICAGMWTHYFSALAWLAHVIYILHYLGAFKKGGLKSLWQNLAVRKNLLLTYILAVALYLPWIPFFLNQSASVQNGFWISEISASTVLGYFTETLTYLDSENLHSWLLVLVIFAATILIILAAKTLRASSKSSRQKYLLLLAIMFIPPALLAVLSLPPLSPVFVSRYVAFAAVTLWLFIGLIIAVAKSKTLLRALATITVLGLSISGLVNVTNREPSGYITTALGPVQEMSTSGEPVLVTTDWNYYDAVAYTSDAHPVHFYSGWSEYQWGSLEPIRQYGVNVFDDFESFQPAKFWVIYNADAELPGEFTDTDGAFSGYRVVTTISNDHHIAIELEKS